MYVGLFFARCEELPGCMVFVQIREECPSLHCGTPLYRVDPVYKHCIFFTQAINHGKVWPQMHNAHGSSRRSRGRMGVLHPAPSH